MPYAYGATIKHEFDVDHLNVYVTFKHPMLRSSDPLADPVVYDIKPPLNKWLLECDEAPVDIVDSTWQDEFTILLTSDTVASAPARVTLEYTGPDAGLKAKWNKEWEPWGPTVSSDYSGYKLPAYVDRGDPTAADWTQDTLTKDGNWHELNCSVIVPGGARAILLRIALRGSSINASLLLRKKGSINTLNIGEAHIQAPGVWITVDMLIACDAARKIEYFIDSASWTNTWITVAGWIM